MTAKVVDPLRLVLKRSRLTAKETSAADSAAGNWTPLSAVTYPVCGALAGLVAAAALFRYHDDLRRD